MKNTFSLSRFFLLFKKHSVEHLGSYLLSVGVLLGILFTGAAWFAFIVPYPLDTRTQASLFILLFLLAGTIFTSGIFSDYGSKPRAIQALSLPASHLEKFLLAWLYSYLIFQIVFLASFFGVLNLALYLKVGPQGTVPILSPLHPQFVYFFAAFAFLHSVALYGSIFFQRLQFVRTGFLFFLFCGFLFVFNHFLIAGLIPVKVLSAAPFNSLFIMDRKLLTRVELPFGSDDLQFFLLLPLTIVFWAAAFFRLREKQI